MTYRPSVVLSFTCAVASSAAFFFDLLPTERDETHRCRAAIAKVDAEAKKANDSPNSDALHATESMLPCEVTMITAVYWLMGALLCSASWAVFACCIADQVLAGSAASNASTRDTPNVTTLASVAPTTSPAVITVLVMAVLAVSAGSARVLIAIVDRPAHDVSTVQRDAAARRDSSNAPVASDWPFVRVDVGPQDGAQRAADEIPTDDEPVPASRDAAPTPPSTASVELLTCDAPPPVSLKNRAIRVTAFAATSVASVLSVQLLTPGRSDAFFADAAGSWFTFQAFDLLMLLPPMAVYMIPLLRRDTLAFFTSALQHARRSKGESYEIPSNPLAAEYHRRVIARRNSSKPKEVVDKGPGAANPSTASGVGSSPPVYAPKTASDSVMHRTPSRIPSNKSSRAASDLASTFAAEHTSLSGATGRLPQAHSHGACLLFPTSDAGNAFHEGMSSEPCTRAQSRTHAPAEFGSSIVSIPDDDEDRERNIPQPLRGVPPGSMPEARVAPGRPTDDADTSEGEGAVDLGSDPTPHCHLHFEAKRRVFFISFRDEKLGQDDLASQLPLLPHPRNPRAYHLHNGDPESSPDGNTLVTTIEGADGSCDRCGDNVVIVAKDPLLDSFILSSYCPMLVRLDDELLATVYVCTACGHVSGSLPSPARKYTVVAVVLMNNLTCTLALPVVAGNLRDAAQWGTASYGEKAIIVSCAVAIVASALIKLCEVQRRRRMVDATPGLDHTAQGSQRLEEGDTTILASFYAKYCTATLYWHTTTGFLTLSQLMVVALATAGLGWEAQVMVYLLTNVVLSVLSPHHNVLVWACELVALFAQTLALVPTAETSYTALAIVVVACGAYSAIVGLNLHVLNNGTLQGAVRRACAWKRSFVPIEGSA